MKTYAILCAAVLALAGCSDENSKIRGEFIAGCVHGGLSKSVCACSFKKIEAKYSSTELHRMNSAPPSADFLRNYVTSVRACQDE